MNSPVRALRLAFVSALFLSPALAFAQRPAPRIRGPIEATPSVPLAGSLNPHLRTAQDLGPLAPDTVIPGITLVFSRSAAQEADLQQLLAQQTDPSSPLYHHWLTPDAFAARFGVADSDIAATQTWLESHGFLIDPAAHTPGRITFSGTAAQIQQAFGSQLHHFRWPAGKGQPAELHFAPASELSLPHSLAPVTAAVLHLSDFRPKPNVRPHPAYTTRSTQSHFLDPADIGNMYDIWPLLGNDSLTEGQGIAILGQSFVQTGYGSMVDVFRTYLGGGSQMTPVLVPNSGVEAIYDGDLGESEIDIEYGRVFAGGANVFFVYTGSNVNYDVFDALTFAITQNIAPVLSLSYGECEPLLSAAAVQQINSILEQAAAQGQTIVVASGDEGATACASYSAQTGVTTAQQQQLAVNFPASSPYVTAVGGTQMAPATFATGTNQYWAAASSSSDNIQSLLAYTPEIVWNEDSSTMGIFSSGGGASSFFPRPSWQSGVPGIPAGSFRLIPDVALQASAANPGYIVCSDDPYLTGSQADCDNSLQFGNGTYLLDGGTSFATPIFAGALVALGAAEHAYGLGNINPVLYSLAAQPTVYSTAFHDITSGTTACLSGDGNCSTPGQSNFAATIGYDQATGLGSVDFAKLAAAWPSVAPPNLAPTYILFSGATSVTPGAPMPLQMTVWPINATPSSTLPSGSLSVSVDGQVIAPSLSLPTNSANAGAIVDYTFTSPASGITHIVTANYSGDATHYPSTATYVFTEGSTVATGSITLSAGNLTLSSNSSGSTQVTITPSGGYNGFLNWTSSYSGGTVAQTICYLVQAPPVSGATTGTINIGVGTACNGPLLSGSAAPTHVQRSARNASPPPSRSAAAAASLALLLLVFLPPRQRRRLVSLLPLAMLAALALSLSGCGGGGSSGGGGGGGGGNNPGPQTYTLTFTAKDSVNTAITASTTLTLTVN